MTLRPLVALMIAREIGSLGSVILRWTINPPSYRSLLFDSENFRIFISSNRSIGYNLMYQFSVSIFFFFFIFLNQRTVHIAINIDIENTRIRFLYLNLQTSFGVRERCIFYYSKCAFILLEDEKKKPLKYSLCAYRVRCTDVGIKKFYGKVLTAKLRYLRLCYKILLR